MSDMKLLCPDYVERVFTAGREFTIAGGVDDPDSFKGSSPTSQGRLYTCQLTSTQKWETHQWDNGGDNCVMDFDGDKKQRYVFAPRNPLRSSGAYDHPTIEHQKDYIWLTLEQYHNRNDFGLCDSLFAKVPKYRESISWLCGNYSFNLLIAFNGIEDNIFANFTDRYGDIKMTPTELYNHEVYGELLFNFVARFYAQAIYAVRDLLFKKIIMCKAANQGCGYYNVNCAGKYAHVYSRCGSLCEVVKVKKCDHCNGLLCNSLSDCQYKIITSALEAGLTAGTKNQIINPGTLKSAIVQSVN